MLIKKITRTVAMKYPIAGIKYATFESTITMEADLEPVNDDVIKCGKELTEYGREIVRRDIAAQKKQAEEVAHKLGINEKDFYERPGSNGYVRNGNGNGSQHQNGHSQTNSNMTLEEAGAVICPVGKYDKDKSLNKCSKGSLQWLIDHYNGNPDVVQAAQIVLESKK